MTRSTRIAYSLITNNIGLSYIAMELLIAKSEQAGVVTWI